MASTKKYDLVAKTGEYEYNGEKKARWMNCGVVFENEKGQLSAKIEGLPVGNGWNGWLTFGAPSEQRNGSATSSASSSAKASASKTEAKAETKKTESLNEEPAAEEKDPDNLPF